MSSGCESPADPMSALLERLIERLDRLVAGQEQLVAGQEQLVAGQEQLVAGQERLAEGLDRLKVEVASLAGAIRVGSRMRMMDMSKLAMLHTTTVRRGGGTPREGSASGSALGGRSAGERDSVAGERDSAAGEHWRWQVEAGHVRESVGDPPAALRLAAQHAAAAEHAAVSDESVAEQRAAAAPVAAATASVDVEQASSSDVSTGGSDSAGATESDEGAADAKTPLRTTAAAIVSSAETTRSLASSMAMPTGSDGGLSTHHAEMSCGSFVLIDAGDAVEVAKAARAEMKSGLDRLAHSLLNADIVLEFNPSSQSSAVVRF